MSDRQQQIDLRTGILSGEQVIDRIYTDLAAQVHDIVVACSEAGPDGRVLTPAGRKRAAQAILAAFTAYFPARRGAPSALQAGIEAQCVRVVQKAVAPVVAEITAADADVATAAMPMEVKPG